MTMTVRELLEALDLGVDGNGELYPGTRFRELLDKEVHIADQPHWPFDCSVQAVEIVNLNEADDEELEEIAEALMENPGDPEALAARAELEAKGENVVVYIAEGRQLGYLPGQVAKAFGWGRGSR